MKVKGSRVLIVGLGESGRAAARFLSSRGAIVSATDLQPKDKLGPLVEELGQVGVKLWLGGHPEAIFRNQDLIIPSPGVPWSMPQLQAAREQGITVAGELEIAAELLQGRVIGVTGTNGKTTTTSLIGHILKQSGRQVQIAGNIGTPVLAVVESSTPETWNVLEVSSFQLEATNSFRPQIAVVLNITPDHLDRHGTFEAYAATKRRITQAQEHGDFLVLNADDEACASLAESAPGKVCWFSCKSEIGRGAWIEDGWIVWNGTKVAGADLPIRGTHNLENALAAVATASIAGVPCEQIGTAISTFSPVEHRLEFVKKIRGVDYYNDSKATNVDAAIKGIESFEGGLWIILGGTDKGTDYQGLREPAGRRARACLLIGASAAKIEQQLGASVPTFRLGSLSRAVAFAHERAQPGETVLLSPACASFDQFKDFRDRGRVFKRLVNRLR